jgi:hypothetical protein
MNGSWQLMTYVQQLFPCTLAEVANGFLGKPILEMGFDTTEGEALPCTLASLFEVFFCKLSIIPMIMKDLDAMLLGEMLKSFIGFEGLLQSELGHEMAVLQSGVMVCEDSFAVAYLCLVSAPSNSAITFT